MGIAICVENRVNAGQIGGYEVLLDGDCLRSLLIKCGVAIIHVCFNHLFFYLILLIVLMSVRILDVRTATKSLASVLTGLCNGVLLTFCELKHNL